MSFCILGTIAHADRIDISSEWATKTDGQTQTVEQQKNFLIMAATQMVSKKDKGVIYRLVIRENDVYISSESGETWSSWGASWIVGETANEHNVKTHECLLNLVFNSTQEDSRLRLLRAMHKDQKSSISSLMQKDVTFEVLKEFLDAGFNVPLLF